jgi:uncharacterized protein (TIGR03118 family)
VITVPAAPGQPLGPVGTPTGLAYNPTSDFEITANGKSASATFLVDTLDGLICGWNPNVDPNNAIILVDNSAEAVPASYTGLTLGRSHGKNMLYAADSGAGPSPTLSNNRVDMFDGKLRSRGSFIDSNVATQFPGNTVFQVENEHGKLYVTFGGFTPPFGGVVDIFDMDGRLLTPNHFIANLPGAGPLENPWGITLAPSHFGKFSNDLLIGNVEGAGNINAFDPRSGKLLGQLQNPDGTPIAIPGLWDLVFGGGTKMNGKTNQLFFDAGPNVADFAGNGLFGVIMAGEKSEPADGGDAGRHETSIFSIAGWSSLPSNGKVSTPIIDGWLALPFVNSSTLGGDLIGPEHATPDSSEGRLLSRAELQGALDSWFSRTDSQHLWDVF